MTCESDFSMKLAVFGAAQCHPITNLLWVQTFIDTSGWAFSFPLARLAGARVLAYVHYPTVSTDMLSRVWTGDTMCVRLSPS